MVHSAWLHDINSVGKCQTKNKFVAIQIWAATWQNQQNECAPSED